MRQSFLLIFLIGLFLTSCDVLQDVVKVIDESDINLPLTEQEVIDGLKEALRVSTDTAVSVVSVINGYYGDKLLKINMPPEADLIMEYKDNPLLQAAGVSKLIDDVILRMNRGS